MNNKTIDILFPTMMGLLVLIFVLICSSIIRVNLGDCDKTYNVDYVIYSKLFCEI